MMNFWWKPERLSHSSISARQALIDALPAAGLSPAAGSADVSERPAASNVRSLRFKVVTVKSSVHRRPKLT